MAMCCVTLRCFRKIRPRRQKVQSCVNIAKVRAGSRRLGKSFHFLGETEDLCHCFLCQLCPVTKAVCQRDKLSASETDVLFRWAVRTPLEGKLLQPAVPMVDCSCEAVVCSPTAVRVGCRGYRLMSGRCILCHADCGWLFVCVLPSLNFSGQWRSWFTTHIESESKGTVVPVHVVKTCSGLEV